MAATARSTGASSGKTNAWKSYDWKKAEKSVRRLQVRIAKAVKDGRWGKAKALQRILVRSHAARMLAVKRVTSNKGKRTPGVDGILWTTPRQKILAVDTLHRHGYRPQPLRRIYIPKKSGKKRPLGIPTMRDRAMQALYKMVLEPIAETLADPNSYGFRLYRSCADAIEQCFKCLVKDYAARWVLEADINACFDEIGHEWMLKHIPMDTWMLHQWLKAGYIEEGSFFPTRAGTPQGGIISPTLANIVLDGLEAAVKNAVPQRNSKVNVIRYADDFIITGASKELLEMKIVPTVDAFLKERGLSLSKEKTRITRIEDGFDFLGQNVRKYKGKLLIKPSKANVKAFKRKVGEAIRNSGSITAGDLIRKLNPKIRGWANYHSSVVSSETFGDIDSHIYNCLWGWMKRRHSGKSKRWLVKKYWSKGSALWRFSTVEKTDEGERIPELFRASSMRIVRHLKIRGAANPYDPKDFEYLKGRKARMRRDNIRRNPTKKAA